MHTLGKSRLWDFFVDVSTAIWLAIFVIDEVFDEYSQLCNTINSSMIPIFIADLYVRYRRVGDLEIFFRKHWFDALLAIPYLRILRIFKALRALKILRISKLIKLIRNSRKLTTIYRSLPLILLKYYKALRKIRRALKLINKLRSLS